ncbi:MAG: DUF3078 domain-containing protein [Saprospiraceae bacterium]|nr:DUF3078 domain-containing protein [Saprospiraceae bacterium]
MKKQLTILTIMLTYCGINGQTIEEYRTMKKEKEKEMKALKGEISMLKTKIDSFPGWEFGTYGTLGYNLSHFNNWQKGANPNAISAAIRASVNGFANYRDSKTFWRNAVSTNLGWLKLDTDKHDSESGKFEQVADVLHLSSLFGYTFVDNLAVSTLAEFNTSVLSDFNNPGILDFGVGSTWKPVKNLVLVMHPLNYHWVFGEDPQFSDALGAKIVADYTSQIVSGLGWKTNLTTFISYKSRDPSLTEWTWANSLSLNVWKGVGIGFEFGLRKAEVEDHEVQSFWVLGLSYNF